MPKASSIVATRLNPAATVPELGWAMSTRRAGAAGITSRGMVIAAAGPSLVIRRMSPAAAVSRVKPLKVATPWLGVTVSVPSTVPPAGLTGRLMVRVPM